jgi:hypothetical protein
MFLSREVHDLVDLGLFAGLAESRQVLTGVAVEQQFVLDHLEDVVGQAFPFREPVFRHRLREVSASENRIHKRISNVISIGQRH